MRVHSGGRLRGETIDQASPRTREGGADKVVLRGRRSEGGPLDAVERERQGQEAIFVCRRAAIRIYSLVLKTFSRP